MEKLFNQHIYGKRLEKRHYAPGESNFKRNETTNKMKAIEIISIPVTDQERSKEFYKRLGFNVLIEAPFEKDSKWVQMGLPGDGPSITLVTWFA
jgi:hypothetical protein